MTERTASDPGAIACPFIAFEDERDERADAPDHRHRCYAEVRPAPRAIAHQQAFCLSPGFAACPTFQDWARREAARARRAPETGRARARSGRAAASVDDAEELAGLARGAAERASDAPEAAMTAAAGSADPSLWSAQEPEFEELGLDELDDAPTRNPHRDWAAPPPWAAGEGDRPVESEAPAFLTPHSSRGTEAEAEETAGLAGSRWLRGTTAPGAAGSGEARGAAPGAVPEDDELERALAEDRAARERAAMGATASTPVGARVRVRSPGTSAGARPPSVSSSRRPVARDTAAPAWERPRLHEAYPTLKTRVGLPSIPMLGLAVLAIVVAGIVLFILPFLLRGGGTGGTPTPTPSQNAAPSVSASPSATPVPSAQVYVVKANDTISKIAKKYGLTTAELLAANPQIKNPNKIAVGDEITIPVPAPSEIVNGASSTP